jgi:hypothetical protein
MSHLDWVHAYTTKLDGSEAQCPECGQGIVEWKLAGDLATRVGFAILWCRTCGKGAYISRVKFPPDLPFVSMSDADAVRDGVPDITFIDSSSAER